MKRLTLTLSLGLLLGATAFAGSGTSGGGARIESMFRVRAYELISKVGRSPGAESLCSSAAMREALETSTVRVVDTLMDGDTTVDRALDAWTVPGDIQLKTASWEKYAVGDRAPEDKSLDGLIIHEVYRATGTCDDNRFVISQKVIDLIYSNALQPRTSQMLTFKYKGTISTSYSKQGGIHRTKMVMCDAPISEASLNDDINCLEFLEYGDGYSKGKGNVWHGKLEKNIDSQPQTEFAIYFPGIEAETPEFGFDLPTSHKDKIKTLYGMASVSKPFYLMVDEDTGSISYGLNPERLVTLP